MRYVKLAVVVRIVTGTLLGPYQSDNCVEMKSCLWAQSLSQDKWANYMMVTRDFEAWAKKLDGLDHHCA